MITALKRRAALIAILASIAALGVAGVAIASTVQYFSGSNTSALGPWHPLTNTTVGSVYGGLSCTSAEDAFLNQVGTAYCISGAGNTTTHPYDGTYRYGWCGTPIGYPAANMNCRETW